jgi:regulation of enolase protein 1 (concanavalin A-like superfamily)
LKILRGQIKKRKEYQKLKKVGFMLILMLVAVSLLVVGCGGEEEANPTATSTVNPTATQPTATSAQPTETTGPTPPTTTSTPAATAAITPTPAATAAITPTPAATAAITPTPAATATATSTPATTTTATPTPTGGTLTFNDNFNGTWDSSWYWTDPNDDATYDFTAHTGFLRLTVPADNDLAGITNYDAPRLWFPYNGNFALETLVEFAPQEIYQGAGLLVWQDENSFLRIEFGFGGMGGLAKNAVFVKQEEGSLILVNGVDLPNTLESIELRLQRDGNQFTAWYRQVGGSWHEIGSTELILNPTVDVGITQVTQYTTSEISADFDYFKLFAP